MKISRIILRRIILREVKNILRNPGILSESDFISKLTSGENVDSVMKTISNVGDLDDLVLSAIKDEKENIESAVSELNDDELSLLKGVLGQMRGSLRSSTFKSLVDSLGLQGKIQ